MNKDVDAPNLAPEVPLFHWRSYRLYLLIILMITFGITSCNFMHLGLTITCMVNTSFYEKVEIATRSDECPSFSEGKAELGYSGDLKWTPMQQSQLFAIFFWFSLPTMSFSGILADRFNAKYLVTGALISYAVLSILSPMLANFHYYAFLAARGLMGIVEGFVFPCLTTIVAHWCPPNERSTAAAIYSSGNQLASLASVWISSGLCLVDLFGGWPLVFYFFGACGVVTAVLFLTLVSNRPEESLLINQKELNYLHEQLAKEGLKKKNEKKPDIPWRAIFTSPVIHAIMASEFSYTFSTSIFVNYLPSFFRDVMAFDVQQNGFVSAMPFAVQIVAKILFSIIVDKLKTKYKISATLACKVMQTVSTFGTACIFISMGMFLDCTEGTLAKILVVLFGLFFSGEIAGAFTATLYVAPSFTGTLSSITTVFGSIGGIVCPTIIGFINKHGTRKEWMAVFMVSAAVNVLAGLIFLIFGSAELQPWAVDQSKVHQLDKNDLKEKKDTTEKL